MELASTALPMGTLMHPAATTLLFIALLLWVLASGFVVSSWSRHIEVVLVAIALWLLASGFLAYASWVCWTVWRS